MDNNDALLLENQLCFAFYACSKEIIKLYQPILSPYNITYTQYICLLVLWKVKSIRVKDLGDKLMLDSGTLTPLLKKLEKNQYVSRERSKIDERIVNIKLTEKGENLRNELFDTPDKIACQLKLSQEKITMLKKELDILIETFRDKN